MITDCHFEILTQNNHRGYWRGSLGRVFRACRYLMGCMQSEIRSGDLSLRTLMKGQLPQCIGGEKIELSEISQVFCDQRLELTPSFENVETIAGGVWLASELLEPRAEDALLKLRFAEQTSELPMHSHDHSDRLVFVARGQGKFSFKESDSAVVTTKVSAGDVLMFSRGLRHTFCTDKTELCLLSYHSPFIPLDDKRQFTV